VVSMLSCPATYCNVKGLCTPSPGPFQVQSGLCSLVAEDRRTIDYEQIASGMECAA